MTTANRKAQATAAAPEPQPQPTAAFDLATFMAAAAQTVETIASAKATKATRATAAERQRCAWPNDADAAASAAGIRLPGLFPKPGSKSAKSGLGWYREPAGSTMRGQPVRGDFARQILWELIAQPIAQGQAIPTAALLATAAIIRQRFEGSSATPPEWTQYLIQPNEARPDGSKVGQQTCLLQQVANMVNQPILLTPDAIRKV